MPDWLGFLVSVLATFRVAHLLAREDGPFDLVVRLRQLAGSGGFGRLLDCPWCLSIWVAAPFAALLARSWGEGVLLWLGISGGATLADMAAEALKARAAPPIDLPGDDGPPE